MCAFTGIFVLLLGEDGSLYCKNIASPLHSLIPSSMYTLFLRIPRQLYQVVYLLLIAVNYCSQYCLLIIFSKNVHRQLLDCGGVHRLMVVTSNSSGYDAKVFHVASRVRFDWFNFV